MWSSRGVEGLQKAIGGGLKRGEVGFKGTEGYRGVRCGNGTVAMKALLNVSVLNVNRPPYVSAFLDLIIDLIIPRFDM